MEYRDRLSLSFRHSRWGGSRYIESEYIVVHHTAMWKGGANFLASNMKFSKPSVHFHIDLDGTVTVYTNLIGLSDRWVRNANHAGESRYGGYVGLNGHSIGIEVEGDTNKRALGIEQGKSLVILCKWIKSQFPILRDSSRLIRHADCAYPRGRKVDIGLKYFDWHKFVAEVYSPETDG